MHAYAISTYVVSSILYIIIIQKLFILICENKCFLYMILYTSKIITVTWMYSMKMKIKPNTLKEFDVKNLNV